MAVSECLLDAKKAWDADPDTSEAARLGVFLNPIAGWAGFFKTVTADPKGDRWYIDHRDMVEIYKALGSEFGSEMVPPYFVSVHYSLYRHDRSML
jgi:hypothetical protein